MACFQGCRGFQRFTMDKKLLGASSSRDVLKSFFFAVVSSAIIVLFGWPTMLTVVPIIISTAFFLFSQAWSASFADTQVVVCHEMIIKGPGDKVESVHRLDIEEVWLEREGKRSRLHIKKGNRAMKIPVQNGEMFIVVLYLTDDEHDRLSRSIALNLGINLMPPPKRFGIGGFGGMH